MWDEARIRALEKLDESARKAEIERLAVPVFAAEHPARVIAVASGKGGVGKSTVSVNLAVALARAGYRVGLLDCDVYGFSVPRMVGAANRKPAVFDGKIAPLAPIPGLELAVISMGFFVEEEKPVLWRGPMLGKMLRQFLTNVLWGELDVVVMDLPPGTGDMAIDVAQLVAKAQLLVVTTPEVVATAVARRAARMAETTKQAIVGVVENMSGFVCPCCGERTAIFGEGGGEELASLLGVPLLARIPLTLEARRLGDQGTPIAADVDSPAAAPFDQLAAALARRVGLSAEGATPKR
ncbi:MAG TPA: Mrp/NBP35 family ATP-binding protein [Limnochordia bacterium]|nr:Mrp/NBP35 family ATP-binding protein [Limnochordia bacterium]